VELLIFTVDRMEQEMDTIITQKMEMRVKKLDRFFYL